MDMDNTLDMAGNTGMLDMDTVLDRPYTDDNGGDNTVVCMCVHMDERVHYQNAAVLRLQLRRSSKNLKQVLQLNFS